MRRRTTTRQLYDAIANNLLQIQKAEIYNKNTRKTEVMDADTFKENLDFMAESGAFVDALGWHYERDCKNGDYIADSGAMNGEADICIDVFLRASSDTNTEEIDRRLLYVEEEW